jgi:nitric oxide reductase activation protein
MNEDVVREVILDSQRKAIEARIFGISLVCIDVVHSEDNLLPQQPVVKH